MKKLTYIILILLSVGCQKVDPSQSAISIQDAKSNGILAGQAVLDTNPIAAQLVYTQERQESQKAFSCSGTLISRRVVLLAAHCVKFAKLKPNLLRIYFSPNPFQEISTTKDIYRVATKVVAHKDYNSNSQIDGYDLALVYLNAEAPLHARVAEIPQFLKSELSQSEITLYGYGKTVNFRVRQAAPTILRSVKIEPLYQWLDEKYKNSLDTNLFVFDQRQAKGACSGDSGGPAFVKQDGRWQLLGVASYAYNLADSLSPCSGASVYTNVQFYKEWLMQSFASISNEENPFTL